MARVPDISMGWSEGRFFDGWMLVHFSVGVCGGFSNAFFGLRVPMVLLIGAAMMIAWEGIEYAYGIREDWANRTLDVVVGLAGTSLALALLARVDHRTGMTLFGVSSLLTALASARGWLAYRQRKKRKRAAAK